MAEEKMYSKDAVSKYTGRDDVYVLKHKDVDVAVFVINENYGFHRVYEILEKSHVPMGVLKEDGTVAKDELSWWWDERSIPKRRISRYALESLNVKNRDELKVKSLGLSLSDGYWINPVHKEYSWENENLYTNYFSEDIGKLLFHDIYKTTVTNYKSPEGTLTGNLKKRWIITKDKRLMVKETSDNSAFNEVMAYEICKKLNIRATSYIVKVEKSRYINICPNITSENMELIPALNVYDFIPRGMNDDRYEHYVKCCGSLGLKGIREELDKMMIVDLIINNTDRHYNNFGILRDSNTLEALATAPLFDNGNSFWYGLRHNTINYMYNAPSKCFADTNLGQLKYISDTSIFKKELLANIGDAYRNLAVGRDVLKVNFDNMATALDKRIEYIDILFREKTNRV